MHARQATPRSMDLLVIAAFGFGMRALFSLAFWRSFGWHAVNHVEHWFYVGVARGMLVSHHHPWDVTWYLLRPGGWLFGEYAFYYVAIVAAALSCVAGMLVYLLFSRLKDRQTGLVAGLMYVGLFEPLTLSTVSFTHDLVQLPLLVTAIYALVRVQRDSAHRMRWVGVFLVLMAMGWQVNPVIVVAPLVGVFALTATGIGIRFPNYVSIFWAAAICLSLLLVLTGTLSEPVEYFLDKAGLGLSFDAPHQSRYPARDVAALSWDEFLARANVVGVLGLLGAAHAFRGREPWTLSLLLVGVLAASQLNRGMRIVDVGLAMAAAYALHTMAEKPSARKTLVWAGGAGILAMIFSTLPLGYRLLITGGIAGILAVLTVPCGHRVRLVATVTVVCIVNAGLFALDLAYTAPQKRSTELEYRVLDELGQRGLQGTLLASWDRGYAIEVVSGLSPVSRVDAIELPVHDLLWLPERIAAARLSARGVEYVLYTNQDFNVIPTESGAQITLSRGLVFRPNSSMPAEYLPDATVYRLWAQSVAGSMFEEIISQASGGAEVRVYRVHTPLDTPPPQGRIVGALLTNHGAPKQIRVAWHASNDSEKPSAVTEAWFGANETRDVVLVVPKETAGNGIVRILPVDNQSWGLTARFRYRNTGGNVSLPLSYRICVKNEDCREVSRRESFGKGGETTVEFFTPLTRPSEEVVITETTESADAGQLQLVDASYSFDGGQLLRTFPDA